MNYKLHKNAITHIQYELNIFEFKYFPQLTIFSFLCWVLTTQIAFHEIN